jgi:hypothetical protein
MAKAESKKPTAKPQTAKKAATQFYARLNWVVSSSVSCALYPDCADLQQLATF